MRPAGQGRLPLAIVSIALATILVLQLAALGRYPAVWFDEGFRFNAARVLADEGAFGSRSAAGIIPFDAALTSGPVEVSLVAASFTTFGLGVVPGRLPFVFLTLASLLLVYAIGAATFGAPAAMFMTLMVAAIPAIGDLGVLLIGRQALSENAAMTMVLIGLWCWIRSWDRASLPWAVAAGLCVGIGLLSKSQFAIPLVPAIGLVAAGRYSLRLEPLGRAIAPVAGVAFVLAGWGALGRVSSSAAVLDANSRLLRQGIEANIVTGLWGATLDRSAVLIAGICLACFVLAAVGAWREWSVRRREPGFWLVVFLGLVAFLNTSWFTLASVGWRRYAYVGYFASLMLAGLAVSHVVAAAERRLSAAGRVAAARLIGPAVAGALLLMTIGGSAPPLVAGEGSDSAMQMSRFIEGHVPRAAVIETWEWELSGLGAHTRYHFPDQRYVYLATYQQGRDLPYDLPYDALGADPDYLVTGRFSQLTGLYRDEVVTAHFDRVADFGPYTLFARRRP